VQSPHDWQSIPYETYLPFSLNSKNSVISIAFALDDHNLVISVAFALDDHNLVISTEASRLYAMRSGETSVFALAFPAVITRRESTSALTTNH
jgi:hypothetical protein